MTASRILVVDDDEEDLVLLKPLLERHGYIVETAHDGAEALVKAGVEPPRLIITELLMPVMDGFTLLRRSKADERLRSIPFVVHTSTFSKPSDERLALDLGAAAFILKPAAPESLMDCIREVLENEREGEFAQPRQPGIDADVVLGEYSEELVRRLAGEVRQLQQANSALAQDAEVRGRAERELRESERHHRLLFDHSPVGLALCRMDGALVYVNPEYARILGRTPEETLRLSYWDITPPRYAEQEQAQLSSLRNTGLYGPYEKEYIHRDGHLVPVRLTGLLIERRGEELIWSSVEEITERKRADEALRQSNLALEMLSECNRAVARASIESELLQQVCGILVDLGQYRMAWVGFAELDEGKSVSAAATTLDLSATLDRALRGALELTGLEGGTVCLVNQDRQSLDLAAHINTSPEIIRDLTSNVIRIGDCLCGHCARTGRPLILRDNASGGQYATREAVRQEGIRFHAAFPLLVQGQAIGVLCIFSRGDHQPSARSLQLVGDLCGPTALVIENARLFDVTARELAARRQADALLSGQKQVLELIATGAALPEALTALVRLIESQAPGMLGSILLLDEDGLHVRHGAAPSLPTEFVAAVDGQPIGPCAGSCGTAAYRKEAVFVEDIATDPLWAEYTAVALPHGLRASWSTPIFDSSGKVLGTFAMYYREPGLPQPEHRRLIEIATHIAAVAISRQRAEASLLAKTEELDRYFNISLDLLCIADTDGYFRRLNPEWERTLGYSLAELTGWRFLDLVHPDDMTATLAALGALSSQGHVLNFVNRYRHKDGSYRCIEWRAHAEGSRIFAVARDITARRQAEAALRRSEEVLQLFVEHSPAAIAMFDREMRYLAVSRRYLVDYDLGEQSVIGRSHYEVFPEIPDRWKDVHRRCLGGAIESSDEDPFPRANGKLDWVRWEIHPWRESDGGIGGLMLFSEVITERKKAEAALRKSEGRYRTLVESASDGIFVTDAQGRLVQVNSQGSRMLGYAMEELLALSIPDIVTTEDVPRVTPELARQTPQSVTRSEWQMRRKDGTLFPGEVGATVLPDGLRLAILRDITERRHAETALRAANEQLRTLSRRLLEIQETERRALARELHDELGQSLTAVKINLQALQRFPDPATPQQLEDCADMVDRALQNTRSLSLNLRPPLLDDLGLLPALRWLADQLGQRTRLRITLAAELPEERFAMPIETACFRITQEALSNVIRHSDATVVTVHLIADAEWLRVRVRDDGGGFDPAEARRRARGGTSMGLLSMEERASIGGGGVEWTSAPGQGTEVHLWLPATRRPAEVPR